MFNLFGNRKDEAIKVIDKIWLTEEQKWKACVQEIKANNVLAVVWFDATYRKLEATLAQAGMPAESLSYTRELTHHQLQLTPVVFMEHYPLRSKETDFFIKLGLTNPVVYSSLDEPLFVHFGGDRISQMIHQLGMKENEALEHKLISGAIKNAQEKIAAKVSFDQQSLSQADWLLKNFSA